MTLYLVEVWSDRDKTRKIKELRNNVRSYGANMTSATVYKIGLMSLFPEYHYEIRMIDSIELDIAK